MRSELNLHNRGALPMDLTEGSQLAEHAELPDLPDLPELPELPDLSEPPEPTEPVFTVISAEDPEQFAQFAQFEQLARSVRTERSEKSADKPGSYTHVRYPRARRSSALIVMGLSALCGAVGGFVVSRSADLSAELAQSLMKPFGAIFLERTLLGAAFLAVEFVLGFFALGDLLVWSVPLIAGLGLSLRVSATEKWALLPSSILLLFITAFGAAVSAGFSETLMQLARGGTVHLGDSPRKLFTLSFLGYLAVAVACALYEGIILNV